MMGPILFCLGSIYIVFAGANVALAEFTCSDLSRPQGPYGVCSTLMNQWTADQLQDQNLKHPELRTLPVEGRLAELKAHWLAPMNRCSSSEGAWLVGPRSHGVPAQAQVDEAFSAVMNQALGSCCVSDAGCLTSMGRLRVQLTRKGRSPRWNVRTDRIEVPREYLEQARPSVMTLKLELGHWIAHRCADLHQSPEEKDTWKEVLDHTLGGASSARREVANLSHRPSWLSRGGFSVEEMACLQRGPAQNPCSVEAPAYLRQEAATLALSWKWASHGVSPELLTDWFRTEGCRMQSPRTGISVGEVARCFPARLGCVTP